MRNLAVLGMCAAILAAGCGGAKTPTAPSGSGTVATAAGQPPDGAGAAGSAEAEVKGPIEALPPATPPGALRAAGRLVQTNASTIIRDGSRVRSFADLRVGQRIEARGSMAGDTLNAATIDVEDDAAVPPPSAGPTPPPTNPEPPKTPNPPETEAEFSGSVSGLTGSPSAFQFSAGGHVVRGDGATVFTGSSNATVSFADLKNGSSVEVKGQQRDGFVQATRVQIEKPETEPGEDPPGAENEVEVEGNLGAIGGTCPAISSSVGSTTFSTSQATTFEGASCTAFRAGDKVQVKGARQSNGSIAATRLRKK